jgi:hypothetical protein
MSRFILLRNLNVKKLKFFGQKGGRDCRENIAPQSKCDFFKKGLIIEFTIGLAPVENGEIYYA